MRGQSIRSDTSLWSVSSGRAYLDLQTIYGSAAHRPRRAPRCHEAAAKLATPSRCRSLIPPLRVIGKVPLPMPPHCCLECEYAAAEVGCQATALLEPLPLPPVDIATGP
jgi:hypothetical protein